MFLPFGVCISLFDINWFFKFVEFPIGKDIGEEVWDRKLLKEIKSGVKGSISRPAPSCRSSCVHRPWPWWWVTEPVSSSLATIYIERFIYVICSTSFQVSMWKGMKHSLGLVNFREISQCKTHSCCLHIDTYKKPLPLLCFCWRYLFWLCFSVFSLNFLC